MSFTAGQIVRHRLTGDKLLVLSSDPGSSLSSIRCRRARKIIRDGGQAWSIDYIEERFEAVELERVEEMKDENPGVPLRKLREDASPAPPGADPGRRV